jgi:hypothetical protein
MSFAHPQKLTWGNSYEGMDELTKISNIQSSVSILNFIS